MEYARISWLCFLGIGVLFFVQAISNVLTGGLDVAVVLGFVGGGGMVVGALHQLARPEVDNGPTGPNLVFWTSILAFALMFAGTVLQFT